jgi:CRISPR-associated exonuclease Cas4
MVFGSLSLAIGLLLLALALGLWLWSRNLEGEAGLPEGKVIYNDGRAWFGNDDVLVAADLRLAGKPDYLIQEPDGMIVPVELKSAKAPSEPHEGHILQLAAYCLLVTENYGVRPDYGIIQYNDRAFQVDYTDDLEEDLLDLLAEMREDLFASNVDRDHNDWARCARCGVRGGCSQRLG